MLLLTIEVNAFKLLYRPEIILAIVCQTMRTVIRDLKSEFKLLPIFHCENFLIDDGLAMRMRTGSDRDDNFTDSVLEL